MPPLKISIAHMGFLYLRERRKLRWEFDLTRGDILSPSWFKRQVLLKGELTTESVLDQVRLIAADTFMFRFIK